MKRLSNILLAGLALVAVASCSKQNPQEPEQPAGIPMTLTATICGTETKLGFTEDSNVLKGAWEAEEKVSVLTINGGMIQTIDLFSTGVESAGQTTANFTGTFSGDPTHAIMVLYPALVDYSTGYGTPLPAGTTNNTERMINGLTQGFNLGYNLYMINSTQSANGNTDHLGAFSYMIGTGSVSGTSLTTTLAPQTSVLQVNITFADALVGKTFGALEADFKDSSSNDYVVDGSGPCALLNPITANLNYLQQYYGSWFGTTQTPITLTASDKNFVAYIPFVPGSGTSIGPSGAVSIEFNPKIDGSYNTHMKTVSLTNSCTLEPGKLYRVSVAID